MSVELIEETAAYRRWRYTDDATGQVIGESLEPILTAAQANEATLRDKARTALQANAAYLALSSPTAAQNTAQLQRVTRECSALIRLMLGLLDSTTDT